MRPADVCGCWTNPSSSSRARMLRTVADDTPSPAAVTSTDDATGSPEAMYSRTSAASTRSRGRWALGHGSVSTRAQRLPNIIHWRDAASSSRAAASAPRPCIALGGDLVASTRTVASRTSTSPSTIVARTSLRARSVDDRRVGVRRGREVRRLAVDDDQIRPFAGLDRADVAVESQRSRARACRHRGAHRAPSARRDGPSPTAAARPAASR